MKILFLLEHVEYGGIQRVAFNAIKYLCQNKHDVRVVYTKSYVGEFLPGVEKIEAGPIWGRKVNLFKYIKVVGGAISDFEPDIIQSMGFLPGIIVGLFLKPAAPVTVISATPLRRGIKWINGILIRRFIDKIILTSWYHREIFPIRMPGDKFEIIPNMIDLSEIEKKGFVKHDLRRKLGLNEHSYIIICVGRLVQLKRIDIFIEIIDRLREQMPNIMGLIVGDGEERGFLEKLVRYRNLNDFITFLGPRPDVLELMAASDLLVHSSETEIQPMVLIEAGAMGLPVVCSDISGNGTIITNGINGFMVKNEEGALGYCDHILLLYEGTGEARRLAEAAFSIVKLKFDIEVVMPMFLGLYDRLLTERNHAKNSPL